MSILLLACAEPPLYFDPVEPGGDSDEPALFDPEEVAWTAQGALDRAALAWQSGLPEPLTLAEAFHEAMSHRDATCPPNGEESFGLEEACTSDEGWEYYGIAIFFDHVEDDRRFVTLHPGSFQILPPEGEPFIAGGEFVYEGVPSTGGWEVSLGGTYDWPGHDSWLGQGSSLGVEMEGGPGWLDLSGPMELHGSSVHVHELSWDEETCPEGRLELSVRDDAGVWSTYTSDGCSGCGSVTRRGEDVGWGCLDLSEELATLSRQMTP